MTTLFMINDTKQSITLNRKLLIYIPAFNCADYIVDVIDEIPKILWQIADILIIFLTYIGFYYGRFYTIILGFLFGIIQDLITQIDLLGAMALTKSAIGFGLGTLILYRNIWSAKSRILFVFLMYFLHFMIFYFIKFNGVSIPKSISIQVIVIHSLLSFII